MVAQQLAGATAGTAGAAIGGPAERGQREAVVDDLARVVVDRGDRRRAVGGGNDRDPRRADRIERGEPLERAFGDRVEGARAAAARAGRRAHGRVVRQCQRPRLSLAAAEVGEVAVGALEGPHAADADPQRCARPARHASAGDVDRPRQQRGREAVVGERLGDVVRERGDAVPAHPPAQRPTRLGTSRLTTSSPRRRPRPRSCRTVPGIGERSSLRASSKYPSASTRYLLDGSSGASTRLLLTGSMLRR